MTNKYTSGTTMSKRKPMNGDKLNDNDKPTPEKSYNPHPFISFGSEATSSHTVKKLIIKIRN